MSLRNQLIVSNALVATSAALQDYARQKGRL